jgi:ABC-2 type transport system permease protein
MKKYWACFKNEMNVSIQYRFDLIGYFIIELLTVGSFLILWLTVYKGQDQVGSIKLNELIIYYLFVPLVGAYTTVELANTLGKHIKDGFVSMLLIKPQKTWFTYVMNDYGHKIYSIMAVTTFYALAYLIISFGLHINLNISTIGIVFALFFAIFGVAVNYAMDLVISSFAFWIDEVWSFKHFKRVLVWLMGGVGFPFEVLSPTLYKIFNLLPFKYLYYLPLSYLNGSRDKENLSLDIFLLIFWTTFLSICFYFLWKRGIKKYGAYGN